VAGHPEISLGSTRWLKGTGNGLLAFSWTVRKHVEEMVDRQALELLVTDPNRAKKNRAIKSLFGLHSLISLFSGRHAGQAATLTRKDTRSVVEEASQPKWLTRCAASMGKLRFSLSAVLWPLTQLEHELQEPRT
jgi:hypothetical protein